MKIFLRFTQFFVLTCFPGSLFAMCGGKYDHARDLLDRTYEHYGTLWSGGFRKNGAGETMDVYRLLRGLPDAGFSQPLIFRESDGTYLDGYTFRDYPTDEIGVGIMRSLVRLSDPEFQTVIGRTIADPHVWLNIHTSVGPYPGWWLTPNAPHLSNKQKAIAAYAYDDGLQWLLTTQTLSALPHTLAWTGGPWHPATFEKNIEVLHKDALGKFSETGALQWYVAAHLSMTRQSWRRWNKSPEEDKAWTKLHAMQDELVARVTDCRASPAEYTAFSLAEVSLFKNWELGWVRRGKAVPYTQTSKALRTSRIAMIPNGMRKVAATQLTKKYVRQQNSPLDYFNKNIPNIADVYGAANFDAWKATGESYFADNIDQLIAIHAGKRLDPKTYRLLNVLSVDHLVTFANSRESRPDEYRVLITAAFLRYVALRRDDAAVSLIQTLDENWPELKIAKMWKGRATEMHGLMQIANALPNSRTLIVPPVYDWSTTGVFENNFQSDFSLRRWSLVRRSKDLPLSIRTGGFLNRDYAHWRRSIGGSANSDGNAHRRAIRRGFTTQFGSISFSHYGSQTSALMPTTEPRFYIRHWRHLPEGLPNWAAWDELHQLGPETGLANRIAIETIKHVRVKTDTRWNRLWAGKEELAQELRDVIFMARRMISGDFEGRPMGQVAFELLHGRLGNTDVAAKTKYWFVCEQRCEP